MAYRDIITKWVIKKEDVLELQGHLSRAGNTFFSEGKEQYRGVRGFRFDQGFFFDNKEEAINSLSCILKHNEVIAMQEVNKIGRLISKLERRLNENSYQSKA